MPGTKRVINIGTNPDDGTGDLLRDALNKVNLNFDDVWEYTSVNSNLNITGDSINGTTDVIINPADTGAFKVTGDTIINPDGGNYNFTINGDLHNNVLYVQASTGRIGVHNTSPTVTLDITGDTKVSGMTTANNLTVTGNTILGDTNTDTVTYNAKAASDFLPFSTTQNIGAPSNRWGYIYTTNLDVTGTIAGTFTGSMTSTLTGDVNNTNVTTVNLNSTGPSNLTDVNISGNLVVQGTTTTLETSQVLVDNSIVFEGATDDAFETTLAITDPTADRTFTFPDATGTVATQEWTNAQGFGGSGPADTDALTEGTTNLYYTDTRADARITAAGSANWNTAYGWGDHSTAGYLTSVPAQTFASLTGKPTTIAGYGITDAFDGDYNSLTNQPTIPSAYTNSDVDAHLNQSNPTSGYVLSWNGTDYAWVANSSGSTFGIAGNTGTHTFNPATETLTFLGTTGQINAGVAANNVTLELASDINSITSISFEGTTADANETKLQAVDPTADNTINLPNASGTVALTGDHAQYTFVIGNNGVTDYTFSDADNHWFPSTENDPVLYLRRGETYIFNVTALGGSHPFEIRASNGGSAYNTGVTNNGASTGNITFKVPMSAPATLYYQCTSHSGMGNTINIV